ncbi:uncharacterized protein [Mycetomoellerius zeteki]|uniref:uncharacterized protein n=1 Tax=Mycetomoellerius zeteki TaxID=64791 RepID=UPI00084EBC60|nr:PREDICTED: uncharacterized protein LOC108728272 [Trachymyrmex zeteki]
MTQVITGHGCFESYLCEINRRNSPLCRYCRATSDTNMYTLLFYPFWAEEPREMLERTNTDRSYNAIIGTAMSSAENWEIFSRFCEDVIRRKEEDERSWERGTDPLGYAPLPHRSR